MTPCSSCFLCVSCASSTRFDDDDEDGLDGEAAAVREASRATILEAPSVSDEKYFRSSESLKKIFGKDEAQEVCVCVCMSVVVSVCLFWCASLCMQVMFVLTGAFVNILNAVSDNLGLFHFLLTTDRLWTFNCRIGFCMILCYWVLHVLMLLSSACTYVTEFCM